MGNRGRIVDPRTDHAIYLHWNGGRDSVEGFLAYTRISLYGLLDKPDRTINTGIDNNAILIKLLTIMRNFFGEGTGTVYLTTYDEALSSIEDHGIYVLEGLHIAGRIRRHAEQQAYPLADMLAAIDAKQPAHLQIGEQRLTEIVREYEANKQPELV